MSLLEQTDPIDMAHWIDRLDAGIDRYGRAEMCEWLRGVAEEVARLRAENERLEGSCRTLAGAITRFLLDKHGDFDGVEAHATKAELELAVSLGITHTTPETRP